MRTSRIVKSMSSTSSHWMRTLNGFYRNRSRWCTVLWYGKCAYSERNDINTEHLFFWTAKNNEQRIKSNWKLNPHPESIAVQSNSRYTQYHRAMLTVDQRPRKINILITILYKTADYKAGSSLYKDRLWVIIKFVLYRTTVSEYIPYFWIFLTLWSAFFNA